jgi:hypothetical protein
VALGKVLQVRDMTDRTARILEAAHSLRGFVVR